MYRLDTEYLAARYHDFLCSYGNVDVSSIISRNEFIPETFFVAQKRRGKELLFFRDISFRDWVFNMILDIVNHIDYQDNKSGLASLVYENVLFLLDYNDSGSQIANQEFVDIIRRIVAFTITGDVLAEVHTAKKFNCLADMFIPGVIKYFRELNLSIEELLKYSIVAGLAGLDLKGAPAAASAYSNEGIKMGTYESLGVEEMTQAFITSLCEQRAKTNTSLFDWDIFECLLKKKEKLIWMTDDYIESHFDLLVITYILRDYDISIEIIPKNGYHGNDLSFSDLSTILSKEYFPELSDYLKSGRLKISPYGAKMGAANIRRLSADCVNSIKDAGFLFAKGCRIHEMLQGGLSVDLFSSFNVVRKLSESTVGFLAKDNEAVFLHLAPGEYAFFGVSCENARSSRDEGDNTLFCFSTIKDHSKRKALASVNEIIDEFVKLKSHEVTYVGDKAPLFQEMNMLARKLSKYTAEQYSDYSVLYQQLNRPDMTTLDSDLWAELLGCARRYLGKNANELSIIDVGTGDGRAIEFALQNGMSVLGIDNSEGFINILKAKADERVIPENSYMYSDMCNINIGDSLFDIVRMNASILHLPIIDKGFTVDLALSEAYRILKNSGLLFINVKYGNGVVLIDTNEGLGGRVYQLYDHALLDVLLNRNGFLTLSSFDKFETRGENNIHWITRVAQKR